MKIQELSKKEQEIVSNELNHYKSAFARQEKLLSPLGLLNAAMNNSTIREFNNLVKEKWADVMMYVMTGYQEESLGLSIPLRGTGSTLEVLCDLYSRQKAPYETAVIDVFYRPEQKESYEHTILVVDQFNAGGDLGSFGAYFYGDAKSEDFTQKLNVESVNNFDETLKEL